MSRVDDRIRGELRAIRRPVSDEGVFELVEARRRRVRLARRAKIVALAVAVLAGTVAGTATLMRVFGVSQLDRVGNGTSPSPDGRTPTVEATCFVSSLSADLNGDTVTDSVTVYSPAASCESTEAGTTYVADVEISTGPSTATGYHQPLPECDQVGACRLFAGPDVDGDGAAEVAIARVSGVSSVGFGLYRFDADAPDGRVLHRFEVAEPGDPWDPNFGLAAGPATFTWYGSVTHLHWMSCEEDPEGRLAALTALRDEEDPSIYRVHGTLLDADGSTLRVAFTWDERIEEDRLSVPEGFCGAEILPPPSR
jgi:hypothetical protein